MNPILPLEFWIPLMLFLAWALLRSSRKSFQSPGRPGNFLSIFLRTGTLIAMGVLLLNPGRFAPWVEDSSVTAWILVDRSASMATAEDGGPSRLDQALMLLNPKLDKEVDLRIATFAEKLEISMDPDALNDIEADGSTTDLSGSLNELLKAIQGDPRPCRGILVLSDGISLSSGDRSRELGLAARADRIPVSAKRMGSPPQTPDLALLIPQPLYTVTSGTNRPIHGRIQSRHLPPVRSRLLLKTKTGEVVDEQMVEVAADKDTPFELHSGELEEGLHAFVVELQSAEEETLLNNNRVEIRINAVEVSLNVLMLEGVPHWDSKFLNQWLRSQNGIKLTTLHRLSDNRWFRVSAGEEEPETEREGTLPGEHQDFRSFDVILVGRGLDMLATNQTTSALHRFVKDHGGVLIFTRGRPVSTVHEGIESLLPLQWLEETSSDHLAEPAPAGIRAGLFGDLLPGPKDPLWQDLPALRGLRRVRVTDGLTTSLMNARPGPDDSDLWPVLLNRRVGSGRVLMINGEGMWHWDFRPDMPRQEKWYGQFWSQLLLWVVQSSRFQPGFDYSVEWASLPGNLQEPVEFQVRHRLGETLRDKDLRLKLQSESATPVFLELQSATDDAVQALWHGRSPGFYALSVVDGTRETPPRYFNVQEPPGEQDDLVPRENPLREIVETSGGIWFEDEDLGRAFDAEPVEEVTADTEAVWHPHWTRGWFLLGLIALPAADWTLRRRRGLI